MLRQFTTKNETDCGLDCSLNLVRRDGRFLGVCGEFLMKLIKRRIHNSARDSLDASVAIRSKISLTNEFKMAIALFEIPVSGCTCLSTVSHLELACPPSQRDHTHPYRCKRSMFLCEACGASSSARHRWLQPLPSWRSSLQPWSPQLSWLVLSTQLTLGPCRQWKRVWVPLRWIDGG
jgi:hypothetical protein